MATTTWRCPRQALDGLHNTITRARAGSHHAGLTAWLLQRGYTLESSVDDLSSPSGWVAFKLSFGGLALTVAQQTALARDLADTRGGYAV